MTLSNASQEAHDNPWVNSPRGDKQADDDTTTALNISATTKGKELQQTNDRNQESELYDDIDMSDVAEQPAEQYELISHADAPFSSRNEQADHEWKYPLQSTREQTGEVKPDADDGGHDFEQITNDENALSAYNGQRDRAVKYDVKK